MHVVWNEMILIPATCLSMYFYLKNESKVALFIYMLIAVSGFVFLGLYEGGWNHTGKLLAYLRIDSPYTQIGDILPKNNGHLWFYEITGVLTFVIAMIAFWYSARFYLGVRNTVRNK